MQMMKYSLYKQSKSQLRLFYVFDKILRALQTAAIVGINRNRVNSYFKWLREKIFEECIKESKAETVEYELDESYFGARRGEKHLFSGF